MVVDGASDDEINAKIEGYVETVYRIVAICLGVPPKSFTWEYYDKSKQYCVVENIKPLEFYESYVKPVYNMEDKVY